MIKNLITFLIYCLSVTALLAQARSESRLQVLRTEGAETVLRLNLSGADRSVVSTPRGPAEIVSIGQGTPLLEKGAPDIPKLATALMIPGQGNMAVEIEGAEFDDYAGVEIAPSKGNLKRTVDPRNMPFEYGPAYQHDAFFPGALAALQMPFIWRDTRGQALWIFPVQYNPVQKVMRVYRSITLRVRPAGGTGINELSSGMLPPQSRAFRQLQDKLFVNAAARIESRGNGAGEPDKMLVIARDDLMGELEPLVAWKRQMGIHTTVVPLSAVGSSASATVYDFVKKYYAEHGITYLLLVGAENDIEPEMRQDGDFYSCDNCFGYMAGDDHFPEILVGRLHAKSPEQLRIMVNRNLEYEKYPQVDSTANWYATGMASCSNEGDGIGDDNQADWQQGNEWKSAHLADGYEQYWEFYDGSHGPQSPTPGDQTADQTGNPSNVPLVDLMNTRGVSLYNYTGHGWEQGLVSGNFNNDAVAALRNHHRYPILIAVACCAGNFTNGECLGEAWQRAGDPANGEAWGGIAGFFSSDFQSWSPPMEGQDGMNQYLADADGISLAPTLSGMLAYGNAKMIAAYGGGGELMADFWNPFIEPSTMPRTRLPKALTATHTNTVPFETTSLTVSCPVEGALVSLFWQDQTWAVATVENGIATLEFEHLNNIGAITVTVSQFNYIPYQGAIAVEPATQPILVAQRFDLDDTGAGNKNNQADYGETVAIHAQLQNVGVGLATGIVATLSTTDPYITLINDSFLPADLNGSTSAPAVFNMTIGDNIPNGHLAEFTLTVTYNDSVTFTANTHLRLNAPVLEAGDWTIDDSAGGNGNKRLDSGETATLRIANYNRGGSDSPNALGVLTSGSPWLSVSDALPLGVLNAANGQQEATFLLTLAPDAPQSALAELHYQVQAGSYSAEKEIKPLIVNAIIETFEIPNFLDFAWQMSGNKPWQATNSNPYSGSFCARSGTITHNQKSVMEIQLLVSEEGIVSFARRVSSESDYDFLRFLVDDVELGAWSGEIPWGEVIFPVSPGQHTLSWIYEKDDLTSAGTDRAWVDNIILPPHQIAVNTGSPNQAAAFSVTTAPNPTNGICTLLLDIPAEQLLGIRVFDCLGHSVQTVLPPDRVSAGKQAYSVDLRAFAPGVYFVEVQGEHNRVAKKIVRTK